jgi:hypothetical protein
MSTTNAFIFSWDQLGIDGIVPISQYEHIDRDNTMRLLREQPTVRSPLNSIIQSLLLRARFNPQRHYEIYAIDCAEEMDEAFWREQWEQYPQATAELIRERGHKIYSDRANTKEIKIT